MNKYDLRIIIISLLIAVLSFIVLNGKEGNYASIYYDNKLIKTIDLKVDNEYIVNGYNGEVLIEVKNSKLKVKKENSPLHMCSKEGYTNKGSIVCLPNKIVIKFDDELDTRIG